MLQLYLVSCLFVKHILPKKYQDTPMPSTTPTSSYRHALPHRAHVVRRPDKSGRETGLRVERSGQAEIAELDVAVGIEEDVGRLDVSVEDHPALLKLSGVADLERLTHLRRGRGRLPAVYSGSDQFY